MSFVYWFIFWFVSMSFVEHFAHRHVMHRRSVLDRWFPDIYKVHALLHHRKYYKVFDHEDDDFGRVLNIKFEILPSLPIAIIVAILALPVSRASSLMVVLAIFAHHLIWNLIHEEMHDPKGRFFSDWRVYKYLRRYHWMHHRYPGKNFNVVLPLADYIWRTHMKPTPKDIEKMKELGF